MKRFVLLAALAIPSCVVVVDDPNQTGQPRPTPVATPVPTPRPTPPPVPVWDPTVTWEDCRLVLYHEYFGFDWDTAGACEYYITQWGIDESDMLVLAFIAAWCRADIHEVVWRYEERRYDLFQVALIYRMPDEAFFCDLPAWCACPETYATAYGYYWRRQRGYVLTNEECRALVDLRIAMHYYGWSEREWFERYERCNDAARSTREVFVAEYARCGRGGRNFRIDMVVSSERPWKSRSAYDAARARRQECFTRAARAYDARRRAGQSCCGQRPPAPPAVQVRVSWSDCRLVIYREYFGFDWDVAGVCKYYIDTHGFDDGDMLVLAFIAASCRADIHDVVWQYERCGFDLFKVAVSYRMTGDEFFIDMPANVRCGRPYDRPYAAYWRRQRLSLSNAECRALVQLRLAVHYYGWTYREWFERYETCQKTRRPVLEVFAKEYTRSGRGGQNYRVEVVVTRERPWAGQRDRETCRTRIGEGARVAVKAYEDRRRAGRCCTQKPPRVDEHAEHEHGHAEEEARREEERRRADEEARRRAEEDQRRRDEEARRREDERRRAEEEARRREEDRRRAEEEAEARRREDERRRAEEERRRREEEEDARRTEDERRRVAEERRAERERVDRCRKFVEDLAAACEQYFKHEKRHPDDGPGGLVRCLSKRAPNKRPYFEFAKDQRDARGQAIDPWGRTLYYKAHSANFPKNKSDRKARNKGTFDLCSYGPNGHDDEGFGDDLANWDEKTEREWCKRCEEEEHRREHEAGEEHRKKEEEERAREEERRHKEDEARKAEDERRKKEEEERRRRDEEARKAEEDRRKKEDEARKAEEDRRKKEDAERRRREEEARKADEERRRKEDEARKAEEERRKEEERAKKEEEERRKKEEEERGRGEQPPPKELTVEEKIALTRKLIDDLCAAIEEYSKEKKKYPPSGAATLVKVLQTKSKRKQPFFKFEKGQLNKDDEVIDAFGNVLHYQGNGDNWPGNARDKNAFNKKTFDLGSYGPNGKFDRGAEDDIANWKPEK